MIKKESEAIIAAARILGHKAFLAFGGSNDGQHYFTVRFERADYSVRFVTESATDAALYAINNQP
jgi:hypothetical protein